MSYHMLPSTKTGDFIIAVVDQIKVGNESDFGAFYQFVTTDKEGNKRVIRDPMAWSLPYGIYAPAEVYDINSVLKNRKDHAYYRSLEQIFRKNGDNRIPPSTNLLEIHTGLSTNEGTIHELAMRFQQTGINIQKDLPLTTFQTYLAGFDGVELMPIEPVIQNTEHHKFWTQVHEPGESTDELTIHLRRPSVTNWGYDTPLYGAASVNPSLLSTGRPHELLQLIETLHNFPAGPVKLLLDVVFGHADKQAQLLLPDIFFAGNNMYGLNINFKHPLVRAIILEIVKRKLGWGIDGLRIDASHDITYYDAETDTVHIDDEFLREMSSVEAEAAGVNFRPWMIFEDARPWPRSDWELACTYRDVTFQQKHPHQWGPMIFAYNTPYTLTYWLSKWWRIREQCRHGNKWITGYANHDTFRRGTQSDPSKSNVNHLLGNSLKAVMEKAYNNPSATLLMNGFLPGVPMDFLHPLSGTPWSFIRNTDTDFSVKITAQEAHFTEWQITSVEFQHTRFFKKLKNLGFVTIDGFRRFAKTLQFLINVTGNNLKLTAELLNQFEPPFEVHDWDIKKLNHFSSCWMQDMCEYCNTDMHTETADTRKAIFNFHVRQFRLRNPWLNNNFGHDDFLHYKDPAEGSVIYYGYRKNEVTGKEIIFLANMEGQANQVTPTQFEFPIKHPKKWRVAVSTPSVRAKKIDQPLRLSISQGIIFETAEHD
ncbi:MAG: hypothetical protein EA391_12295 [Balneolaceae bacterium]|nr:MAG: hypothetical protein EA391_12295 [Balneolaceae bacterium]